MPFSKIIPPSPSPTESKRLFYTSVSLLLSRVYPRIFFISLLSLSLTSLLFLFLLLLFGLNNKNILTWDVLVYSSYSLSYSLLFSWYWEWYSCSFLPTASILSSFTNWSYIGKQKKWRMPIFLKHGFFHNYLFLNCISVVSFSYCISTKYGKPLNPFVNTKTNFFRSHQNR